VLWDETARRLITFRELRNRFGSAPAESTKARTEALRSAAS
jgi:hypothetical protein